MILISGKTDARGWQCTVVWSLPVRASWPWLMMAAGGGVSWGKNSFWISSYLFLDFSLNLFGFLPNSFWISSWIFWMAMRSRCDRCVRAGHDLWWREAAGSAEVKSPVSIRSMIYLQLRGTNYQTRLANIVTEGVGLVWNVPITVKSDTITRRCFLALYGALYLTPPADIHCNPIH